MAASIYAMTGSVADWRCLPCALATDLDFRQAPAPDVRCSSCGEVANPCALLRNEVRALHEELRALRHVAGSAAPRAATPSDSMTPKETAAYLNLPSERAVYMAVRRGQIPAHRLGRRLRFYRSELDAILARR